MNDNNTIYMNDPEYIEEVCVGYGDPDSRDGLYLNLYLQKHPDDRRYAVLDEFGTRTGYTWSPDDYADDAQSYDGLRYLFYKVYTECDPEVRP